MRPLDPRLVREAPSTRRFLLVCVVLAACAAAATIAQAALLAWIVTDVFLRGADLHAVLPALLALAGATAVRALVAWAFESGGHLAASRVTRELRLRLVSHLLRARPAALRTGEAAATATSGLEALDPYFARFLPQLVLAALVPPAILVFAGMRDLESALIMVLTLPLIPAFGILIGKATEAKTRSRLAALERMGAHFLDVVRGLPTLRAYRRGAAQAWAIADTTDAYRRGTMGTLRVAFLSALVLELAATLGTAVVAVEIGVRLVGGGIGLEPALAILVLAPELYAPWRTAAAQFHASADGLQVAGRVFELLDLPPAVATPSVPVAVPSPARVPVRLERVSLTYAGRAEPALADVSLELAPAERVALAGPSGAGKSSLLALLLRFLAPDQGRVSAGGVDLADVDPDAWRAQVAWLPQRPRLAPGPLLEAVRAGAPVPDEAVREALRAAGAWGFVAALPEGEATRVGEGGLPLSAGQVRRLALARALARPAPLLLLDEPTAHLDGESAAAVAEALRALPRARTLLVATHDESLLGAVDRVLALEHGGLRERRPARRAA